jgi:hypothetical protein
MIAKTLRDVSDRDIIYSGLVINQKDLKRDVGA